MSLWKPFQKTIIDKTAEMLTRKLVVISEKYFVNDLPKYPIIEPSNGKNTIKNNAIIHSFC